MAERRATVPLQAVYSPVLLNCGHVAWTAAHSEGLGIADGRLTARLRLTAVCTMADGAWQAGRMEDNIVSSIVLTLKDLKRDKAQNGSVKLWFVLYLPKYGCKSQQELRRL